MAGELLLMIGSSMSYDRPMSEPAPSKQQRPFWHRSLDPEERRRVLNDLALIKRDDWTWRFTVMLTLSVLVAVMGLLAGSPAVVIGAMLLAPLMTPVLGTAASLAMGLPRRTVTSGVRVILASVWCIALAWVASKVALTNVDALSSEIESRTRPDLRDLIVALAAGTAGAYATVRSDTSNSLPGVAVAVALVPPLATVGITLEAGNMVWARGALLLYVTNLVAIILAGIVVFLVTGFVPPRRLVTTVPRIFTSLALAVIATVLISFPLLRASQSAADESIRDRDGRQAVEAWLADTALLIQNVDFSTNPAVIEISGPGQAPPKDLLEAALALALGPDSQAAVFIDETSEPTTTSTSIVSNEERREARVQDVLRAWLAENDDGNNYELNAVRFDGAQLLITVSGLGQAPPIQDLIARLEASDPSDILVPNLRWSQLEAVPNGEESPTPLDVARSELEALVERWGDRFDLEIVALDFDGIRLVAEVEGPAPAPLEPLLDAVAESDVLVESVEVYFTQRIRLDTTTTTVVPETTTVPGATTVAPTTGPGATTATTSS